MKKFVKSMKTKSKNLSNATDRSYFIPTLNCTGFATEYIDPYTQHFVDAASKIPSSHVMEVGSGYGYATIACAKAGAHVISNDIEPKHLWIMKKRLPENMRDLVSFMLGAFPDEIDLPDASLHHILMGRVLHLWTGDHVERALACAFRLLKPGGQAFLVVDTPYSSNWSRFIPEFRERKAAGDPWPGYLSNFPSYVEHDANMMPDVVNFMDDDLLRAKLEAVGFVVEACDFFPRIDYPSDRHLNGQEGVGAVATKPA